MTCHIKVLQRLTLALKIVPPRDWNVDSMSLVDEDHVLGINEELATMTWDERKTSIHMQEASTSHPLSNADGFGVDLVD